jgi:hypothetical protein
MYVGLSVAEAERLAVERGELLRTLYKDGQAFAVTMERLPGRVNLVPQQETFAPKGVQIGSHVRIMTAAEVS